jgi:hypothetical protein
VPRMTVAHAATQGPIFISGLFEEVARTARDRQAAGEEGKLGDWDFLWPFLWLRTDTAESQAPDPADVPLPCSFSRWGSVSGVVCLLACSRVNGLPLCRGTTSSSQNARTRSPPSLAACIGNMPSSRRKKKSTWSSLAHPSGLHEIVVWNMNHRYVGWNNFPRERLYSPRGQTTQQPCWLGCHPALNVALWPSGRNNEPEP